MESAFPKLIIASILILFIVFLYKPNRLSMLYIFFRPLVQPFATKGLPLIGHIPVTAPLPIYIILYTVTACIFNKRFTFLPPNIIALYFFLLFSSFSFLNSMDTVVSIGHLLKFFTAISLYILVYNAINSIENAKNVLKAICISTILPMLYGFYQYVTKTGGGDEYFGGVSRVSSFLGGWNEYGIFLCLAMCAAMIVIFHEQIRIKKLFYISLLILMVISSVLALNRGSWITFSAALSLAYFPYRKKIKLRWFFIAGFFIFIFFADVIADRFFELSTTTSWGMSQNTFTGRIEFWKKLSTLLGDHPFVGYGLGTSRIVATKFFNSTHVPHNDYLSLALETGFLGVIFYLFFLIKEFVNNVKVSFLKENWKINYPIFVMFFYWTTLSLTQNMIYNVIVFPIFMTILAAGRKWNKILHENQ